MSILKVTEVFSVIQLPNGNVKPYYAVVKTFDPQTGLADLQVSRMNTNNNPQFENVSYLDVPPVRVLSYPCGLPHVGPKLENLVGVGTLSSSGDAVTGTGTSFTTQLVLNDEIKVSGGPSCRVKTITDDTHMTVDHAPSPAWSNAAFLYSKDASMNCIYMPSGDMSTWMMGIFLSTDPVSGLHSAAFPDGNGGVQTIQFPEMEPAPGTGPSMWIPLNIGYTEDAIKTWFADPANYGPLP